jgi:hypothetical protein
MILMSFSMTEQQYVDGTKDVTRRLGWWRDKHGGRLLLPGEQFMGVRKGMGLKKGEKVVPLGPSVVVDIRREPLSAITPEDVAREGFPGKSTAWFIDKFCRANRCTPSTVVTRIVFRHWRQRVN